MTGEPREDSKMVGDEKLKFQQKSTGRILLCLLAAIAIIVLIVGIVLIALAAKKDCDEKSKNQAAGGGPSEPQTSFCDYSEEAKRIDLNGIILRAKRSYYENHPFQLTNDPDATRDDIKEKYTAYNPTPEYIKQVTDAAWKLFKEVNETKVEYEKLKPRERKSLSQLKHYLKTVFGQPFDMNYYAGDWMMGPTFYCKQPICDVGKHLQEMLKKLKPKTLEDIDEIERKLKTHKDGILRYMENVKMGKLHGMVYSEEACVSGRNALKRKYLNIASRNETGKFLVQSMN